MKYAVEVSPRTQPSRVRPGLAGDVGRVLVIVASCAGSALSADLPQ
jgi:hypothetical protein